MTVRRGYPKNGRYGVKFASAWVDMSQTPCRVAGLSESTSGGFRRA